MDKFKKSILRYKNQLYFSLAAIVIALGVFIGFITVDRYKTIVNATLGGTVLYLLYDKFLSPKSIDHQHTKSGVEVELPHDLKYFIYGLISTIIAFWAGVQVIHLIWYLINTFTAAG